MNNICMKDLPPEERPYERLRLIGTAGLSDAELLAILLRSGTRKENSLEMSRRLLSAVTNRVGKEDPTKEDHGSEEDNSGENILHQALSQLLRLPLNELMMQEGIGWVKAAMLQAVGEIARRYQMASALSGMSFSDPAAVAAFFRPQMCHLNREEVHAVWLDTRLHYLGSSVLSVGSVNRAILSAREIFIEALQHCAVNIILVHNHPSGDPEPSEADISVTRKIANCASMLELPLLDHLIIGNPGYYSMRENHILDIPE